MEIVTQKQALTAKKIVKELLAKQIKNKSVIGVGVGKEQGELVVIVYVKDVKLFSDVPYDVDADGAIVSILLKEGSMPETLS